MKTSNTLLFSIALSALALASTSCGKDHWPNCIKANKKNATETRSLENFTEIQLDGSGDVYLYQLTDSSLPTVEIETSENVMDRVTTEVKGNKLVLSTECIRGTYDLTYTIRVADLSKVKISGSGNVTTMTPFNLNDVNLEIDGSGNMDFETDATNVACHISGSGNIELDGTCDDLDLEIDGSGDIHAFDMPTTDCFINISGSGNCEVYVNGILNVTVSGSGDVIYDGTPTEFSTNSSGSGTVRKR
jgi:hypothetical protein